MVTPQISKIWDLREYHFILWVEQDRKGAFIMQHRKLKSIIEKGKDYTFLLPASVFLIAFLVYPIMYNINLSFRDVNISNLIEGERELVGFANYITVLQDPLFMTALINSILFTAGTILLSTSIGFALALYFNK